jgi:hypothetical protein
MQMVRGLSALQGCQDLSRRSTGVGLVREGHTPCARHLARGRSRVNRARREGRGALKRNLGTTASLSRNPRGFGQERPSSRGLVDLDAVERFNELRKNIAVGGLFHSTC